MLILAYHAIGDEPSPITTSLSQLRGDLVALKNADYSFQTLDDCADWLEGKQSLPRRSVALTFDDGYQNVVRVAAPLLVALDLPATVFVIAGRLGVDNGWSGQWSAVPRMPLMTASDVREAVSAGIAIGAHTCSHPSLPELDDERLAREVRDAGDRLEQLTGAPVRHFAYPYGRRGPREIAVVAARYRTAVSATPRLVARGASPHDLPRLDAHDIRVARQMRLLNPTWLAPYVASRRLLRRARRRLGR